MDDEYIKKQQPLQITKSSHTSTEDLRNWQQRKDYDVNDSSIVFSISNILSADECLDYVHKAESAGFEPVNWEYHEDYRKCERVVFQSFDLSQVLWDRIKHHLTRNDIEDVKPFGFENEGVWIPFCVNPCIRFTKYGKDDHFVSVKFDSFVYLFIYSYISCSYVVLMNYVFFCLHAMCACQAAHKDGGFVFNEEQRSVYTLMIYLNSNENDELNQNSKRKIVKAGNNKRKLKGRKSLNSKQNLDSDKKNTSKTRNRNTNSSTKAKKTGNKKRFSLGRKKKKKENNDKQTTMTTENKEEEVVKKKAVLLPLYTFTGGTTKFYSTSENNVKMLTKEMIDKGKTIVVTPSKGTAVIFNHDIWHEGCPIESGYKYILRTDIVFRRVEHKLSNINNAVIKEPLFHECEALYQKSIQLQKDGDAKGSTLAYLDALTIQAKISSMDKTKRKKIKKTRTKGLCKDVRKKKNTNFGVV